MKTDLQILAEIIRSIKQDLERLAECSALSEYEQRALDRIIDGD